MAISVSVCTIDGAQLLEPTIFPGPAVKMADLRARLQEGRVGLTFQFSLGDRVLCDTDELADPELLITASVDTDYAAIPIDTFEELNLKDDLLRGIYHYGFEKPSGLQKVAIRPLLDRRNLLSQAQTGTGKTASYVVAALQMIDPCIAATQTLVFAPTRELACPIQKVALALGDHMRITAHSVIGGTSVVADIEKLAKNPHFVSATPGHAFDMARKGIFRLDALKLFVLDEMDELMSRGFRGLIFDTIELFPPDVQLAIFSATMPQDMLEDVRTFLRNPVQIRMNKEELTLEGLRQFYVAIEKEDWKVDTLSDIFETFPFTQVLIYCNTRRKLDFLACAMAERGIAALTMHAELDKKERDLVLQEFLPGGAPCVLISTDLFARAIDKPAAPVVINYDLPMRMENYLHRVGRSGHFYRKGTAINFVTHNDVRTMRDIERHYHTKVEELPIDIADLL